MLALRGASGKARANHGQEREEPRSQSAHERDDRTRHAGLLDAGRHGVVSPGFAGTCRRRASEDGSPGPEERFPREKPLRPENKPLRSTPENERSK